MDSITDSDRNSQLSYVSPSKIIAKHLKLQPPTLMPSNLHRHSRIPKPPTPTSTEIKLQPSTSKHSDLHHPTRSNTTPATMLSDMKLHSSTSMHGNLHRPTRLSTAPTSKSPDMKLQLSPLLHGNLHQPSKISKAPAPTSTLLQDLIQKQRTEMKPTLMSEDTSQRSSQESRRTSQDTRRASQEAQRFSQESERIIQPGEPETRVYPRAREMGLREQEEHVDKIIKQNFDLKVDIFYQRKHNVSIEQRNNRLEEANKRLLEELGKRDQTIEEAVATIHGLEEKVKELEGSTLPPTFHNPPSSSPKNRTTHRNREQQYRLPR